MSSPKPVEITSRKLVWVALSKIYLDTALQDHDYTYIARCIANSPYTLAEAKAIDRYEVFPVLYLNLWSVAGAWSGFDENWLVQEIQTSCFPRKKIATLGDQFAYWLMRKAHRKEWAKIERRMCSR